MHDSVCVCVCVCVCVYNSLVGVLCARKVTITRVSRIIEQTTMSMVTIIYFAGEASTEYGVE